MKQQIYLSLCLLSFSFTNLKQQQAFTQLQELSGSWMMKTDKQTLFENWVIINSNEMHGKSYRINNNDTTLLEEVKLSGNHDKVLYIPVVKGENKDQPVSFKLISFANKQFVFENSTHDFPQRVIYHLIRKDSIHAWIEGKHNGKDARSDYYFKRAR